MKALLILILLSFSLTTYADLNDGDVARFEYSEVPVYKVLRVRSTVSATSEGGQTYYSARLRFRLRVEGNTCGGLTSTLGNTQKYVGDNHLAITLLTGARKTPMPMYCAEYSKPASIVLPLTLDLGTSDPMTMRYDFGSHYVLVKWAGRKITTEIVNRQESLPAAR